MFYTSILMSQIDSLDGKESDNSLIDLLERYACSVRVNWYLKYTKVVI